MQNNIVQYSRMVDLKFLLKFQCNARMRKEKLFLKEKRLNVTAVVCFEQKRKHVLQ